MNQEIPSFLNYKPNDPINKDWYDVPVYSFSDNNLFPCLKNDTLDSLLDDKYIQPNKPFDSSEYDECDFELDELNELHQYDCELNENASTEQIDYFPTEKTDNDLMKIKQIVYSIFDDMYKEQNGISEKNKIHTIHTEKCQHKARVLIGITKYDQLINLYGPWHKLLEKIGIKSLFYEGSWWSIHPERNYESKCQRIITIHIEKHLEIIALLERFLIAHIDYILSFCSEMSIKTLILRLMGGKLLPDSDIIIKGIIAENNQEILENKIFRKRYGPDSDKIITLYSSLYKSRGDFMRFLRRQRYKINVYKKFENGKEIRDCIIGRKISSVYYQLNIRRIPNIQTLSEPN